MSYSLLSFFIVLLFSLSVFGQVKNTKKLACLPPESREGLVKRLELFIQYDRAREYGKQFDLLSHSFVANMKFDREAYIEFRHKEIIGTLLELKIYDMILHLKEGYIEIPALAKTKYKGNVVDDSWIIKAYVQDGEWYFDYTWIDV